MTKQLTMLAALALLACGCGETTTNDAQTTATEMAAPEAATTTAPADSATTATQIDNAAVEIEDASAEVDSLLNEI